MSDLHKRKRIMKHLIKKKQNQPTKEKPRTGLQKKEVSKATKLGQPTKREESESNLQKKEEKILNHPTKKKNLAYEIKQRDKYK
jgi:hypothetical protein